MSLNVEELMAKVIAVAETLGLPVDIDRRFSLDEDELPRVTVWSGEEASVAVGPYDMWAEEADTAPVIDVLFKDDPKTLNAQVRQAWNTLRAAIRATPWDENTVQGYVPSYTKTFLELEDEPGISGFSVLLNFRVELD